jgi:glucokinase
MKGRFLVADIGATNARFALPGEMSGELPGDLSAWTVDMAPTTLATREYSSVQQLLGGMRDQLDLSGLDAACFAVAGPVQAGQVRMTNHPLVIDAPTLSRALDCPVTVVNDYYALAQGLPRVRERCQIGGRAGPDASGADASGAEGVIALVGPGTGLGVSALLPRDPWPQVLTSEGGHGDLAPGNPLEQEILQLLSRERAVVSWETVLSGPGLVSLYGVMAELWGVEPEPATPQWVCEQGAVAGDPICHQTLETFFGFLGSAAGNLALVFGARGGVYIGGGIVPRLSEFALASPLRRRFEERGALADYVADIPMWIIMDAYPGLVGAWECLRIERSAAQAE